MMIIGLKLIRLSPTSLSTLIVLTTLSSSLKTFQVLELVSRSCSSFWFDNKTLIMLVMTCTMVSSDGGLKLHVEIEFHAFGKMFESKWDVKLIW
ncbi:hypothetical protein GQ457_17G007780 [Hibiscus cannabinus]